MAGTNRSNCFPVGGEKKSMIQNLITFLFQLCSLVPRESYLNTCCRLSILSRISVIMMKQLTSSNGVRKTNDIYLKCLCFSQTELTLPLHVKMSKFSYTLCSVVKLWPFRNIEPRSKSECSHASFCFIGIVII